MNIIQNLERINTWIKENPNITDPNFYEIFTCLIEVAEFKKTSNNPEEIKKAQNLMDEMLSLRKLNLNDKDDWNKLFQPKENDDMLEMKTISLYLLHEIRNDVFNDTFVVEENERLELAKKEVLRKTASINLYIFQMRREEPEYHYDNQEEFDNHMIMYDYYMLSSKKDENGKVQYQNAIEILSENMANELEQSKKKTL